MCNHSICLKTFNGHSCHIRHDQGDRSAARRKKALGQGGYVISVWKEKGSQIHYTRCRFFEQRRKSLGGGRWIKYADIRDFHSKILEETLLFWVFERVEPNIIPCEECKPRGMKAPDIPDCDRELYDWMKSEEKTISNMRMLMYKFIDAYTIGVRPNLVRK